MLDLLIKLTIVFFCLFYIFILYTSKNYKIAIVFGFSIISFLLTFKVSLVSIKIQNGEIITFPLLSLYLIFYLFLIYFIYSKYKIEHIRLKSNINITRKLYFLIPISFLIFTITSTITIYTNLQDFVSYTYFYWQIFIFLNVFMIYLIIFRLGFVNNQELQRTLIKAFSWTIVAIISINFIISVLQMVTGLMLLPGSFNEPILYTEGVINTNRAVGLIGVNNGAGNLSAILFLYVLINRKNFSIKTQLVLSLMLCSSVLLTQTRIAILTLFLMIMIYGLYLVLFSLKQKKTVAIFSLTASFLLIISYLIYLNYSEDIIYLFTEARGATGNYRGFQFNFVYLEFIRSFQEGNWWILLFGRGLGTFEIFVPINFGITYIGNLHSQLLSYLFELGLIPTLYYFFANVIVFLYFIKKDMIVGFGFVLVFFIPFNYNPNQYYDLNVLLFNLLIIFNFLFIRSNNIVNAHRLKSSLPLKE